MKGNLRILMCFMVVACLFSGCSRKSTITPDTYKTFLCYDYHLACLEVENKKFVYNPTSDMPWYKFAEDIIFRKIKGESDDQFIQATITAPLYLGAPKYVILQNPNKYVDVWNEWSIKKIEFFYIDLRNPVKQDKSALIPSRIVDSTDNNDIIADIKNVVAMDTDAEVEFPEGYAREYIVDDGELLFYVRIHFNESDNIVWETEIKSYYSSSLNKRMITIDKGRTPNNYFSKYEIKVALPEETVMYIWLDNLLDRISF